MLCLVPKMFSLVQIAQAGTLAAFMFPYILACIFFAMTCSIFIPVSYTHLGIAGTSTGEITNCYVTNTQIVYDADSKIKAEPAGGIAAVSYTHLDVYKRQNHLFSHKSHPECPP